MKNKKLMIIIGIVLLILIIIGGALIMFLKFKGDKNNETNNEVNNQLNNGTNNRINVAIGNETEPEKEYIQDDYKNAILWYYIEVNENILASAQAEYNEEEDKYIVKAYYYTKDEVKGVEVYTIDAKTGKGTDSKNNEIDFKNCLDKAYKDRTESKK